MQITPMNLTLACFCDRAQPTPLLIVSILFGLAIGTATHAVENANIEVDAAGNVTIPAGQNTSDFHVDGNGSTGVIPIRIGASSNGNASAGILLGTGCL